MSLRKKQDEQGTAAENEMDCVMRELKKIAFTNWADFMQLKIQEDGETVMLPLPTCEIPPEKLAALQGYEGTGAAVKAKTYDKMKALEMLCKYFALPPEQERTGPLVTDRIEIEVVE